MRVLSVCSGIAADAVAWHPLGWQTVAFAETKRKDGPEMSLIFYDVETTGLEPTNDQIMAIAAIETDAALHTGPAERTFKRDVRLGIDRVPHPSVLLMQAKYIDEYRNPGAPSRLEALADFAHWIDERPDAAAKPATFIGWNSAHFDDPFVAHEWFRALWPPYAMADHYRHDAMRMVQLATWEHGEAALKLARNDKGKPTYGLAALTTVNGVWHSPHHTAEGDVRGMINLLAQYRRRLEGDFERHLRFANPAFTRRWLAQRTAFTHAEFYFGNPSVKPVTVLQDEGFTRILTLDLTPGKQPAAEKLNDRNLPVRRLSLHAPLLMPYDPERHDGRTVEDACAVARQFLLDEAYRAALVAAWRERKARRDAGEARPDHFGASLYRARVGADALEDMAAGPFWGEFVPGAGCADALEDMQAFHEQGAAAIGKIRDPRLVGLALVAALERGEDLTKWGQEAAEELVRGQLLQPAETGDGKAAPLSLYGAMEAIQKAEGNPDLRDDQRAILNDYNAWLLQRVRDVQAGRFAYTATAGV